MKKLLHLTLIQCIIIGIIVGTVLGTTLPSFTAIGLMGELFIGALKAFAPLLVFFVIVSSLSKHKKGNKTHMKTLIVLYLAATLVAAFTAVIAVYLFRVKIILPNVTIEQTPPESLYAIISSILSDAVMNPVQAISEGSYLALLFWGSLIGLALRVSNEQTKLVIGDIADAISSVIQIIINFAPFGIAGLVYTAVAELGLGGLAEYGKLILLVVGTMFFVGFVVYPFMTWIMIRQNPYPLTFYCMKESGIPAFFTRSGAVNIPINMELAKKLQLSENSYSISIPLGAAANSGGAAITISVMTLATAFTLGYNVPFTLAFLLCLLTAIASTGVSGIAGGSLLLIPLAASLFSIPNDIAMQVVGVGFIIGVIQDSVETALNSASDLLFTAVAEFYDMRKAGEEVDVAQRVKEAKMSGKVSMAKIEKEQAEASSSLSH